jgi:hypothetical protein
VIDRALATRERACFIRCVALQHTMTFRYEGPLEKVLSLVLDPSFVTERSTALGETDVRVTARRDGDRVVVVNQRNVRRELPSFAAKLFSSVNEVTQTENWDLAGDVKTGTFQIAVKGAPVKLTGTFDLRADGTGTLYRVTFDVAVKVPLIGGKLERFTLDQTIAGEQKQLEHTASRVRG